MEKSNLLDLQLVIMTQASRNRVNNCRRYREIAESPIDLTMMPRSRTTIPACEQYFSAENFQIVKAAGLV